MASRSGQKSILGYASASPANAVEPTNNLPSNESNKKSRGTRFDSDGRVTIRGARNNTGSEVFVTKDEIYDDVMMRGMRKTGIARKFGVSEKGDSVKSFLEEIIRDDPRRNEVLTAIQVKQGERAGNIFDPLARTEAKDLQKGELRQKSERHFLNKGINIQTKDNNSPIASRNQKRKHTDD